MVEQKNDSFNIRSLLFRVSFFVNINTSQQLAELTGLVPMDPTSTVAQTGLEEVDIVLRKKVFDVQVAVAPIVGALVARYCSIFSLEHIFRRLFMIGVTKLLTPFWFDC